jgi:hypothetical protein
VLSIPTVFGWAGFDVTATDVVEPVGRAGAAKEEPRDTWSDKELHDAMQDYWNAHRSDAHHGIWVFFCSSHDFDLGGTMFDLLTHVSPRLRYSAAAAEAKACHEIRHCFNLAHSRVKWVVFQDGEMV